MTATAVLLTRDDESGERFILTDPDQLDQPTMILADPDRPGTLHMVNTAEFLAAGYTVSGGDRRTPKAGKRRFGRKGKSHA
jgi:hypothetical protein